MSRGLARRRLRVPVLIALAALACSGCGISLQTLPQLGSATGPGYKLRAVFGNVQDLAANAKVRYGDAVVGDVTGISAHDFTAYVTMHIERRAQLPAGTRAQVRFDAPLGDEYVELEAPSGATTGTIRPGSTLGLADTSAAPTVADTLAALGAVLYGGGLAQARDVVVDINQILGDNHGQFRQLLANLGTVIGSLAGNDRQIDAALVSADHIVEQLNQGHSAIDTALATLPPAAKAVSADNDQLRQLLSGVNRLSPVVLDVLAESGQDLVDDVSQLGPIASSLETAEDLYGSDLSQFTTLSKDLKRAVPNGYVQLNVDFGAGFPAAEPPPDLQALFGCTAPTPPSQCPPGSSLADLFTGSLP